MCDGEQPVMFDMRVPAFQKALAAFEERAGPLENQHALVAAILECHKGGGPMTDSVREAVQHKSLWQALADFQSAVSDYADWKTTADGERFQKHVQCSRQKLLALFDDSLAAPMSESREGGVTEAMIEADLRAALCQECQDAGPDDSSPEVCPDCARLRLEAALAVRPRGGKEAPQVKELAAVWRTRSGADP